MDMTGELADKPSLLNKLDSKAPAAPVAKAAPTPEAQKMIAQLEKAGLTEEAEQLKAQVGQAAPPAPAVQPIVQEEVPEEVPTPAAVAEAPEAPAVPKPVFHPQHVLAAAPAAAAAPKPSSGT